MVIPPINNNNEENKALQQWKEKIDSKDKKSDIFSINETPGPKRTEKLSDFIVHFLEKRGLLTGNKKALIPKLAEALNRINPKNAKEAEAALGIYLRENDALVELGFDQSEIKDIEIRFDRNNGKVFVRAIGLNDVLIVENTLTFGEGGPESLTGDDIRKKIDDKSLDKSLKIQPKNTDKSKETKETLGKDNKASDSKSNWNLSQLFFVLKPEDMKKDNEDNVVKAQREVIGAETKEESKELDDKAYQKLREKRDFEAQIGKSKNKKAIDQKVRIASKAKVIEDSIREIESSTNKSLMGILDADIAKLKGIKNKLEDTRKSAAKIA